MKRNTKLYSEEELKRQLSPEAYRVMRENGTEAPFSGALLENEQAGTYYCALCKKALFESDSKFDAGCGWPSFLRPQAKTRSPIRKTYRTDVGARKYVVRIVIRIWDMYLMTDPHRQKNAIALIRWHCILRKNNFVLGYFNTNFTTIYSSFFLFALYVIFFIINFFVSIVT